MKRLIAALTVLAAAPAVAQESPPPGVSARFDPSDPGKGTGLVLAVDGTKIDQSKTPSGLRFTGPPGMVFAPSAVAERCSDTRAREGRCPDASRIGAGRVVFDATVFGAPQQIAADLQIFLGERRTRSDLAGVAITGEARGNRFAIFGRVLGGRTPALLIESLPAAPQGVTARLRSLDIGARASRRVTVTRTRRVRGKRRKVRRRETRHLLTTPGKCPASGAYPASAIVTFSEGSAQTFDVPLSCRS